jgi:hypothetical protein
LDSKDQVLLDGEDKKEAKGLQHEIKYMEKVDELQKKVEDKSELMFKPDFFSLTALSFLKKNGELPSANKTPLSEDAQGYGLKSEKLAQMLYSNSMIAIMILTMVGCLLY